MSDMRLDRALAFIAISGTKRGLHLNTRMKLDTDLATYEMEPTFRHVVTEKGMELARRSRLWKAHEDITARGFSLRSDRKHTLGHLSYHKFDESTGKFVCGFVSKSGTVYVDDERGRAKIVAEFKNG